MSNDKKCPFTTKADQEINIALSKISFKKEGQKSSRDKVFYDRIIDCETILTITQNEESNILVKNLKPKESGKSDLIRLTLSGGLIDVYYRIDFISIDETKKQTFCFALTR